MTAFVFLILIACFFYEYSFAKYNWDKGNKKGGIGVIILTISSAAFAIYLMFR